MKKVFFSVAAIMALSLSAFAGTPESKGEAKPEVSKSSSQVYHYTGESTVEDQFRNPANWSEGNSSAPTCGSGLIKPCEITAEDETELEAMLSGKSNSQVLAISDNRRD